MSEQFLSAADLVAHPERIADVAPAAIPAILAQLAAAQAQLATRLLEVPAHTEGIWRVVAAGRAADRRQ
jgi:hypothetical protein